MRQPDFTECGQVRNFRHLSSAPKMTTITSTDGDLDAKGAVLSESYLQYDLYKTRFKGGRQHIVMPLIANSGSRMIKESFEGYFLSNTDLPDTTLSAGWVNRSPDPNR